MHIYRHVSTHKHINTHKYTYMPKFNNTKCAIVLTDKKKKC